MRIGPYEVVAEVGRGGAGVVSRLSLKSAVEKDPMVKKQLEGQRALWRAGD